jgi:hypothetical protein
LKLSTPKSICIDLSKSTAEIGLVKSLIFRRSLATGEANLEMLQSTKPAQPAMQPAKPEPWGWMFFEMFGQAETRV